MATHDCSIGERTMTQLVSNDIGPGECSEGGSNDLKSDLPRAGKVLVELLDKYLKGGQIRFRFGGIEASAGADDGFETVLRVNDPRLFSRVLRYGNLGLGEAFMDGDFAVERGELHEFMTACLRANIDEHIAKDFRLAARLLAFRIHAFLEGSTKSVRRHYDTGDDVFESFLDSSLTYSCGYALSPGDDLDSLQRNKMDRICRKLQLKDGDRLLDIGCGFGGLLIFAAREYGARGTGITTSLSHAEGAKRRVTRLSEITRGLERCGLAILDVENMGVHYAYTARHWLARFRSSWARLSQRYDESFLRMWEYYFHCAIAASYASDSALFQTLFSADRTARLPLKRI